MIEVEVLNAAIVDRRDLTREISVIQVRPDSGVVPEFSPGQFIKMGLPREESAGSGLQRVSRPRSGPRFIRRAYSITSSPQQRDYLEFLLVRVVTGKLTPKLWQVAVGGRVWLDDKASGSFALEAIPPGKDVVMVATGTGVAPFVSMLRTYHDRPPWRRAVLINGVRCAADLAYRDELEVMSRDSVSRVTYVPIVSRESADSGWTGLRGRVQRVLEPACYESYVGMPLSSQACHVMLCGNPEMIVSTQKLLEARGFREHSTAQPGNIHFERYW